MTRWIAFAGFVGLLTTAMVILSYLTQQAIEPVEEAGRSTDGTGGDDATTPQSADEIGDDRTLGQPGDSRRPSHLTAAEPAATPGSRPTDGTRVVAAVDGSPVTARGLVANVAVTQGLFLALLVTAIVLASVPLEPLGVDPSLAAVPSAVAGGVVLGVGFYVASEVVGALAVRAGFDHDEWLRESLAPTTGRGWVVLLVAVLPLIAVFEELLFRAVLIGAFADGFGFSVWLLAVASSIVFAVGHGIQGTAGILVTGLIGFGLAAAFVLTESLLLVVVAHYVLNGCEFVIHEGLDVQWQSALSG